MLEKLVNIKENERINVSPLIDSSLTRRKSLKKSSNIDNSHLIGHSIYRRRVQARIDIENVFSLQKNHGEVK